MNNHPIPFFIIGASNNDQKQPILNEFAGKTEFDVIIKKTGQNPLAINSFNTIKEIVKDAINLDAEVIIICESEHRFTT